MERVSVRYIRFWLIRVVLEWWKWKEMDLIFLTITCRLLHPEMCIMGLDAHTKFGSIISDIFCNIGNVGIFEERCFSGDISTTTILHVYSYKRENKKTRRLYFIFTRIVFSQMRAIDQDYALLYPSSCCVRQTTGLYDLTAKRELKTRNFKIMMDYWKPV